MSQTESKVIRKIKKGNQQAFKQLYNQYADYALRTAFAIIRNKYDASDVVQETFIRVYRNIHSFDHKKSFRPWFYQILINECRRYVSQRSKQAVAVESTEILDFLHNQTDESVNIDQLTIALERLDEDDKTLIILKYLDGFTEKELAQVMKLNVNTVKSRLYRARKRLKTIILGGGMDE